MRRLFLLLALAVPAALRAQYVPDQSSAVQAALAAANAAMAKASTAAQPSDVSAAITAATPSPCATPPADTLNGNAGTGTPCMARPDASRPTAVQTANTTLGADCSWSVTFARAFTSSSPIVHASVVLPTTATQPLPCSPTARSTTVASGKCFPGQTTALTTAIVTGGVTVNPFGTTCTAGLPVMVVGREPTQ